MFGLYKDETYGAMKNYDDGYDSINKDRNEDRNDDENAASGSGSNDPIFGPITTPQSRGGGSIDGVDGLYGCGALCINHI